MNEWKHSNAQCQKLSRLAAKVRSDDDATAVRLPLLFLIMSENCHHFWMKTKKKKYNSVNSAHFSLYF